jgi:hypothetical protein
VPTAIKRSPEHMTASPVGQLPRHPLLRVTNIPPGGERRSSPMSAELRRLFQRIAVLLVMALDIPSVTAKSAALRHRRAHP